MNSLSGKFATGLQSLYSATKYGLRGFALAAREDLAPHGVGVSTVYPGFVRDAGMFADTGVELPRYIGTSSPPDVAGAVLRAIEHDRAEIDVAPLPARAVTMLFGTFPALGRRVRTFTPEGDRITRDLAGADSHREKR
jgi:short-subunit dehydrogenase